MKIRKILGSIMTIGVVALVAIVATRAFFSDTESSLGNTFTAGAIDLLIDSEAHYAGMFCNEIGEWQQESEGSSTRPELLGTECTGTWESTDLDTLTNSAFFNYTDIKPGDEGENTISLTVENNEAWVCMNIDNMQDLDNTLTEPEEDVDPDGLTSGELAENLHFTAWLDQGDTPGWQGVNDPGEGDNIWQGGQTEPLLFSNESGPASDVLGGQTYALADAASIGGPLVGGVTNYIGLQWCAGTMTIDESTISCDGSAMGNEAQTDSLTADIHLYAEQSRNNPDFSCANVDWPDTEPQPEVEVGAVLGEYTAPLCDVVVGDNQDETIADGLAEATSGQTVCVEDGVYSETVVIDEPTTLAAQNGPLNSATIQGGVNIKSSDVTLTGFIVNPGTILGENVAVYIDSGLSNVDVTYNDIDGLDEASSRGVLFVTSGTYNDVMITNNFIHDLTSGVYMNPLSTATNVHIMYNDIDDNSAGIGGYNGAHVAYNEFGGAGTGEAIGADSSYDGSVVEFNNFLTGWDVITYGSLEPDLDAPNNWWADGAEDQTGGTDEVDFTPVAAGQYPHQ